MTDALLHSIPDAAVRVGIGKTLLYEMIASGEIRTIRVGRRRLVPESELQGWVERQLAEPPAAEAGVASRNVPPARRQSLRRTVSSVGGGRE